MHSTSSVVTAGLLGISLLVPSLARADTPAPAAQAAKPAATDSAFVDPRLLAVGAGAVVGIVAFNVLTGPFGAVPLAGGVLEEVPYSIAMGSRTIAVVTAGVGALAATWAYDAWNDTKSDYLYLASLATGALAGVLAGNFLAIGALGLPPYYLGAAGDATGALASSGSQAASRVYVIGSGVLGAWVADHLYRKN